MKKNNNVIKLSNITKSSISKKVKQKLDSDIDRLNRGYKRLSPQEKDTLFILLDAFLCMNGPNDIAG